jgi:Flp pilus assembly protein TadG
MGILRGESAQTLVLTALCLTLLMGGMALAVDVGYLYYRQRQLQTAADSAAIAAGLELGSCGNTVCPNMETAATAALKEDGITSSTPTPTANQCTVPTSTGLAIIINVAPCVLGNSDPNNGNVHMAEVVLTEQVNTFFGGVLGIRTVNLVARAEAGDAYLKTAGGTNCIYTNGMQMNSNSTFYLINCGIYDGGNLGTDSNVSGTATDFIYYGSWSPNNCHKNCSWTLGGGQTQPTHTTTQQTDPLAGLFTTPSVPTGTGQPYTNVNFSSNQTNSMPPGHYQGDVNINSNVTINLSPGLYYFDGSFNIDSNSTVECLACTNGAGVTLYFNSGSLQVNSNATVNLTATTAGNTASGAAIPTLLLWASANASNMVIDSNGSDSFAGIIYLPYQSLTMNSNSNIAINGTSTNQTVPTMLDVNYLMLDSNQYLTITGEPNLPGSGSGSVKLGSFALAE